MATTAALENGVIIENDSFFPSKSGTSLSNLMNSDLVYSDNFEAHNHRRDVHENCTTKLLICSDTE